MEQSSRSIQLYSKYVYLVKQTPGWSFFMLENCKKMSEFKESFNQPSQNPQNLLEYLMLQRIHKILKEFK